MLAEKRIWLGVDLCAAEIAEVAHVVKDAVRLGAPLEVVKQGYGAQGDIMHDACPRCGSVLDGGTAFSCAWRIRCAMCGAFVDDVDWYAGIDLEELDDDLADDDGSGRYQVWDDAGAHAIVVVYEDDVPVAWSAWKGA